MPPAMPAEALANDLATQRTENNEKRRRNDRHTTLNDEIP
jgi:hypothetical protein